MLTRVRIEVSGEDSSAAVVAALNKYEHALQVVEADRYRLGSHESLAPDWGTPVRDRDYVHALLGQEVTQEVVEFDPSSPGYKGRRVVKFTRVDTR